MPKMTAILSRRNLERALKHVAHRIHISKPAFARDRLHGVLAFFQTTPRRFDAETLDKLRRRCFHFFSENTSEIARAHRDALGQYRNGERFVQIIQHPCFELSQGLSVRGLERKRGAELCLPTWP